MGDIFFFFFQKLISCSTLHYPQSSQPTRTHINIKRNSRTTWRRTSVWKIFFYHDYFIFLFSPSFFSTLIFHLFSHHRSINYIYFWHNWVNNKRHFASRTYIKYQNENSYHREKLVHASKAISQEFSIKVIVPLIKNPTTTSSSSDL